MASPAIEAPRISIRRSVAGQFVLQFEAVAGRNYVIEHTPDLRHAVWTAVTSPTLTFPIAGTCQWIDDGTRTGGLTGPFRAYRVKLQAE